MRSTGICRLALGVTLLILANVASAIAVKNGSPGTGPSSVPAPAIVERGGLVKSYDARTRTLLVDESAYVLSGAVAIHGDSRSSEAPDRQLRKGVPIRFNTTNAYQGRHRIVEIWILKDAVIRPKN